MFFRINSVTECFYQGELNTIIKAADLMKTSMSQYTVNLHLTPEMHKCLFIICVIVYNLYYCYYAKTSSPAVQIRHSKVYGSPYCPLHVFNSPCLWLRRPERWRLDRQLSEGQVQDSRRHCLQAAVVLKEKSQITGKPTIGTWAQKAQRPGRNKFQILQ